MDIFGLIGWRTEEVVPSGRAAPAELQIGDRLRGKVARRLSQKLALVDLFGGRYRAVAQSDSPLHPGQRLDLEVTAITPRLTLKTISPSGADAETTPSTAHPAREMRRRLHPRGLGRLVAELRDLTAVLKGAATAGGEQASAVAAALDRLVQHLRPLDPDAGLEKIAAQIKSRLRDGGHFFDQKLVAAIATARDRPQAPGAAIPPGGPSTGVAAEAELAAQLVQTDLKPQLQRLLLHLPAHLESLGPEQTLSAEATGTLWSAVVALLEEIEHGQRRLAAHRREEAPAMVHHSLWVSGRDTPLRLTLYLHRRRGQKGAAPRSPSISLLLDLQRFGKLRVDLRERSGQERSGLKVQFWTQSDAVRAELMAFGPPLETLLSPLYPQIEIMVKLSPDKITAFETETAPRPGDLTGGGRLDVRA